jgi:hypothetical protein
MLQDQIAKLRNARDFGSQQDKYYALEGAIRRSDLEIEESKKRCELVSARLKRDVDRFRIEFHERMRHVLESFHRQQAEYLQLEATIWESALPSLVSLDTHRSELPTVPKVIAASSINLSYSTEGAKAVIKSASSDEKTTKESADLLLFDQTNLPGDKILLDVAGPPSAAPPPPPVSPSATQDTVVS